ncbi:MAG: hypothetical protein ABI758_06460 [Candidatus Woesebacteria bacterium]
MPERESVKVSLPSALPETPLKTFLFEREPNWCEIVFATLENNLLSALDILNPADVDQVDVALGKDQVQALVDQWVNENENARKALAAWRYSLRCSFPSLNQDFPNTLSLVVEMLELKN